MRRLPHGRESHWHTRASFLAKLSAGIGNPCDRAGSCRFRQLRLRARTAITARRAVGPQRCRPRGRLRLAGAPHPSFNLKFQVLSSSPSPNRRGGYEGNTVSLTRNTGTVTGRMHVLVTVAGLSHWGFEFQVQLGCQLPRDVSQSLHTGRAGRKAHYGRPAKATGRLARRAQQDPAAGRPVRGGIEQRVDHRGAQRRPRAVPDHVQEPLGPTAPGHRSTNPAIAGAVVKHRTGAAKVSS